MPLIYRQTNDHLQVGIWQISESMEELRPLVDLSPKERQWLNQISGQGRRLEWLASRVLAKEMVKPRQIHLFKDDYGKPHIHNIEKYISISHSHGFCAVSICNDPVGIDIQMPVEKIARIRNKFMNAWELHTIHPDYPLEPMHQIWSAKECIYKIYGRKQVNFKHHMTIDIANNVGYFHKENVRFLTTLDFQYVEGLYLTIGINHRA